MSDALQRKIDEQYRLHELREGARRFAVIDFGGEEVARCGLVRSDSLELACKSLPASPLLTPDNWEGWLAKREEIAAEEKRAFNERFGYIQ